MKMKIQKLFTKTEFVELLKNNKIDSKVIDEYNLFLESILIGRENYELNNLVSLNGDKIDSVSLNYYCKSCYKFLFPYKVDNYINSAIHDLFLQLKGITEEVI